MINYVEYLNVPIRVAIIIVAIFFGIQIIGEILEFKGKVAPEWMKIRKYIKRKREECEMLHQIPTTLTEVQKTLNDFNSHYNSDNIQKRDAWIESVNNKLTQNDELFKKLDEKLDKNNKDTLDLLIDNKRNFIINFASKVIDKNSMVTREQFNRAFKAYTEYESIIKENNMVNGEVDVAIKIINQSYREHMENHTFVEDIYK